MSTLTIRKVPDEVHRALRVRAALNGRSVEAEVRAIIERAVAPKVNLADALGAIGKSVGGIDIDFARDRRPYRAEAFE
jgi:antitoxin FitA